MITVFTRSSLRRLADLGFDGVKVASYDCASFPLLRDIAERWSTVVVSTGATYDREVARVLRPGGRSLVAMSHRCFPTKAIRAFHVPGGGPRFRLVSLYHAHTGRFDEIESIDRSPPGADPLWIVSARRSSERD